MSQTTHSNFLKRKNPRQQSVQNVQSDDPDKTYTKYNFKSILVKQQSRQKSQYFKQNYAKYLTSTLKLH